MASSFQAPVKQSFCRGRQNACLTEPTSLDLDKEVGFNHHIFNTFTHIKNAMD
jgi:hypothetical protein